MTRTAAAPQRRNRRRRAPRPRRRATRSSRSGCLAASERRSGSDDERSAEAARSRAACGRDLPSSRRHGLRREGGRRARIRRDRPRRQDGDENGEDDAKSTSSSRSAAVTRWRRCRALRPSLAQAVQDPGSHQAPADPAGAGGQGRARQQGRGADDLPLAGRPLFRADAEHRRVAAAFPARSPTRLDRKRLKIDGLRISRCRRAWASSCAPPVPRAPRSRSSATSNT